MKPRALVVDDDAVIREVLGRHLAGAGWDSVMTPGVSAARPHAERGGFDLVIVDHQLRDGKGRDVVDAIRDVDLDVPILVISGGLDVEAITDFVKGSVDDTLFKPLHAGRLRESFDRLLRLGRDRRRRRRRTIVLLDLWSSLASGGRGAEVLQGIVAAVPEITPFRRAALYLAEPGSPSARRVAAVSADSLPETVALEGLEYAYARGFRLDSTSFVPGSLVGAAETNASRFSEWRARRVPAEKGDHGLVEIRAGDALRGFLVFEDADDGLRPTEDHLRLISLLATGVAVVLENRGRQDLEALTRSRLEMVRDVMSQALERADLSAVRTAMTGAAVSLAGYSFSAFLERGSAGEWACEAPCPTLNAGTGVMRDLLELQAASTAPGRFLEFERQSFIFGRSPRVSLALPVFSGPHLRGFFVVEDDAREAIDDGDRAAFQTMCDQVGLLRRRLEHETELERKTAELQASYARLDAVHQENIRMQEVLRRYVPPSTWEKIEVGGTDAAGGIEQTMTCAIMFVDICGFTRLVESAKPAQVVGLLNAYFTAVAAVCYQHGGEIVKYIGDGIMGFFRSGESAVTGVREILEAQSKISEQVAALGLGEIRVRVGVSWGPVIVTSVGPFYQQDRTILGDTVNTAARLESRALPGSALFDSALLEHREPSTFGLATVGVVSLRGKRRPVTALTLAADRARYTTEATGEIARPDEGSPGV